MGLVARGIEAAGIPTVMLSNIPILTAAAGAPRIAAIEYPIGLTLGRPDDCEGQLEVLRALLGAAESIEEPGGVVHLPFDGAHIADGLTTEPSPPPPIVGHLLRHPWQLPRLLKREVRG